jgi:hypothetical protein
MRPSKLTQAEKKLIQAVIKEGQNIKPGIQKSSKKSMFDTPLFSQEEKQTKLF